MDKNCLTNDPVDIGYLIWRISKFWQRGKHRTLDEFDLTGPQMEVLGATYHFTQMGKSVTQIMLSQETDVDPMTTSTILRNLQKKGYINRRESQTDTRARIVEITEAGSEAFVKALTKVKESQKTLFKNIDVVALKTQLQILLDELDKTRNKNI
ncbi:MAG: MarR family winged helix-turn-helix transcriptional regulator [Dysgonomonas sp.]